jgi:hypothetical protein
VLSTEETQPAEKVMAASVRSQRSITRKEPPVLTAAELAAVEATAISQYILITRYEQISSGHLMLFYVCS